jgi:hypothetical protein
MLRKFVSWVSWCIHRNEEPEGVGISESARPQTKADIAGKSNLFPM